MSLGENSLVAAYQGKEQLKSRPSGIRVVTFILSSGNRNILFSILLCMYLPLCVSVSLCLFLSHSLCLLVYLPLFLSILLSVAPSPPATQSCLIRFSFLHSTNSACMYARLSVCLSGCLPT